jgi:hypothetical protein
MTNAVYDRAITGANLRSLSHMRKLLVAFLIITSAACKEEIVGSSTVTGTYTLRTLNNTQLPYTLPGSGATKTEVLDDAITFYQGNTYAETRHVRLTTNGQVTTETQEDAGAYSFFGISLTLTSGRGNPERRGRIDGNTMTIIEAGLTSVYRK